MKNKTHIIDRKMINGFLTHSEYANFAYLQRFGILYYIKDENGKKLRGHWGVALSRLHKFLKNEWPVAEYFWRDVDTDTNEMSQKRILLSEIKYDPQILNPETMLPVFLEFETDETFRKYEKE